MTLIKSHRVILKRCGLILTFATAVLCITSLTLAFDKITNVPTAAFSFLILVLLSAFVGDFIVAVTTSVVAALCFNYFYLPPLGTFNIDAFSDWISLAAFLLTAVAISGLTSSAAQHSARANALDKSLSQLKEFGVWLLSIPDDQLTLTGIAEEASRIFSLEYCSIHIHSNGKWQNFIGASASATTSQEIEKTLLLKDHPADLMEIADENTLGVRYMQVNRGTTLLAVLAIKSTTLPANAFGTMAYMIGRRVMEIMEDNQSLNRNGAK